jgi:hypothetical protein
MPDLLVGNLLDTFITMAAVVVLIKFKGYIPSIAPEFLPQVMHAFPSLFNDHGICKFCHSVQ